MAGSNMVAIVLTLNAAISRVINSSRLLFDLKRNIPQEISKIICWSSQGLTNLFVK